MADFEKMSTEDLKKKITELDESIEEIEEEKRIVLGQTGLHLPGHTLRKYEAEIAKIKEQIAHLQNIIENRG